MGDPSEDAFENLSPSEQRVFLPPGQYPGKFLRWEEVNTPWGLKLCVYWQVFPSGEDQKSVQLRRHYNLSTDKDGKWIFGDGHDYRKDWIRANRGRLSISRT